MAQMLGKIRHYPLWPMQERRRLACPIACPAILNTVIPTKSARMLMLLEREGFDLLVVGFMATRPSITA